MTYTATPLQEVWLLKHRVWDLFDDGLSPDEVVETLIADGRQPAIAELFVAEHASQVAASSHSDVERQKIVDSVCAAVQQADQEQILVAMDPACDDDRTVYKVFIALSWLLYDPPPDCQWAAFALSKMPGYGDFALVQALEHEEEFNRYVAAFGLGTMGGEAANTLEALEVATYDDSELVKSAAAESIRNIQAAQ